MLEAAATAGAAEELVGEPDVAAHGAHGGAGHRHTRPDGVAGGRPSSPCGMEWMTIYNITLEGRREEKEIRSRAVARGGKQRRRSSGK